MRKRPLYASSDWYLGKSHMASQLGHALCLWSVHSDSDAKQKPSLCSICICGSGKGPQDGIGERGLPGGAYRMDVGLQARAKDCRIDTTPDFIHIAQQARTRF